MRKRIYARLVAGLLCGTLLCTDASMMGVTAASIDSSVGTTVSLTKQENEDKENDTSVIDVEKEGETEKKPEEESLPAEKSEEETSGSEGTGTEPQKESDGKEENPGTETGQPAEQPKEETGEQDNSEEDTEKPDSEKDRPEGETVPVEEEQEEEQATEEDLAEESVSENTLEEDVSEEDELGAGAVVMASEENIASGEINESYGHITWVIDASGKLTVEGIGDYTRSNQGFAPWREYAVSIKSAEINVSNMTNATCMFCDCINLKSINLENLDTSTIKNMYGMFWECKSLENLTLGNFNTSNVTKMTAMFKHCTSLTNLDLSSFNTGNVREMDFMFDKCQSLTNLDLSNFDTINVEYLHGIFRDCSGLTVLDLSCFDLSKITTSQQAPFENCNNLKTIHTPRNLSQALSLPQPDPYGKEKWKWYRPDGKVVTTLPQDLSYSIILGKDYIPTETQPDNPPDDDDPEEEYVSKEEKFVREVTKYSLTNADEQTRNSIQKALYNLLFRAHFSPVGQDPGKKVTFPGNEKYNREWPYQNGIQAGKTVRDPRLGTITYAKACAGCLSYARFASQYVYGHIAEATYIRDMSVKNVKKRFRNMLILEKLLVFQTVFIL